MPDRLELELRALGQQIAWPDTPDIATDVEIALKDVVPMAPRRWNRVAWVAAALILGTGLVLGLSPSARRAAADFLGIGGARIEHVDRLPEDLSDDPRLGTPVTLEEARAAAGRDILVPSRLGTPDAVYVDDGGSSAVSLVYGDEEAEVSLTSFLTDVERAYVRKLIAMGVTVERVDVGGDEGFWIVGDHAVMLGDGTVDEPRLAGNTLLWERGGITYRLETGAALDPTLEIAESLQ